MVIGGFGMVRNYWLTPERIENFEADMSLDFKVKGFSTRYRKTVAKIRPGDRFVIYISSRKSVVAGIVTAKSEYYEENDLVWDDFYDLRVSTEPYIVLSEDQWISFRDLVDDLNFIKNKRAWKVYLMNSIKRLSEKDYLFIESKVKRKYKNAERKLS